MKWLPVSGLLAFSMIFAAVGQNSGPTIRVDVVGSFVWREDGSSGALSSTIEDPLTGHFLHRLSYEGIEVTLTVTKRDVVELSRVHCLTSGGSLSPDKVFSLGPSSQVYSVAPQTATIMSATVRDPRDHGSVLCSTAGCYPTGTMRYVINVDGHDYVFIWTGRSVFYCGK
jgi:hypothetical protein